MPAIKGYTDLYHLQLFAKKWRALSKTQKHLQAIAGAIRLK